MIQGIQYLEDDEQNWLVNAIASVIAVDVKFEGSQHQSVRQLFKSFFKVEPEKLLKKIAEKIKKGKKPKIKVIKISDPNKLIFILDILSASVFVNGKRLHLETERYFEAGKNLGLRLGLLSYRLSLEVKKERVKRKLNILNKDIRKEFRVE